MYIFEPFDDEIRRKWPHLFSNPDVLTIQEDGTFLVSDEMVGVFRWLLFEKFCFTFDGQEENKMVFAYNVALIACYMHFFNPKEVCFGRHVSSTIIPILNKVSREIPEKITNPEVFWDYYIEYLKEHSDFIDNAAKRGLDVEAEIVWNFCKHLISVLKENK